MKVLVTGFAPFSDDTINPSYEAVRRLPARIVSGGGALDVVTAELPTSFARAPRKLRALIARVQPEIVLCVGLAAERAAICVERIAVNLCDARTAARQAGRGARACGVFFTGASNSNCAGAGRGWAACRAIVERRGVCLQSRVFWFDARYSEAAQDACGICACAHAAA